ncbi:MAG: hypothetical protein QM722_01650 [Piscinibacter sp.]
MTYFIAGVIALIVFSGGLNAILGANPKWLSAQIRKIGGYAAFAFALFLVTRGQCPGWGRSAAEPISAPSRATNSFLRLDKPVPCPHRAGNPWEGPE